MDSLNYKEFIIPLKISKVRKVKSPERATSGSVGIDFYIPEEFPYTWIKPQERILIPSGIKVNVPEGFGLIANNKSGIANKYGLIFGSSVVDNDYEGEVHISLINTSNEIVRIGPNQKIIQFLLIPLPPVFIIETDEKELFLDKDSQRKSGGFGSTGE